MPLKPTDNLILVYTKFQQEVISLCIEQSLISRESVIIDHNISINEYLHSLKGYKFLGANKLFKFLKLLFYRLKFGSGRICNLIIPHNDGLLANFFYQKALKDNSDVTLYYEGVLSFYKFQKSELLRKFPYRKIISVLLLFKYQDFSNIYPYNENIINQIIVPDLENALGDKDKKKLVEFPFLKINSDDLDSKCALIIGTPLYGTNEKEKKEIFDSYNYHTLDLNKVVYKPHPREDISLVKNYLRGNIEIISDNDVPVENIFMQLKSKYIYSTTSSSVLNIKLANENVEITTFWKDGLINENSTQIKKVFEKINIKVLHE